MKQIKWWHDAVFYQIWPRSFCDSNGDGIGDIQGIISKLDYLKDLGINALWLSPVYPSPNYDYGYDISDYTDINPEFGTLEDMKELFAEAKKRDIKIIMDLVINHTSTEHKWFLEAINNPNSKYHDYYIFKKGKTTKKGKKLPPNNWDSMFMGPAWEYIEALDEWYLHLFAKEQADLNWRNPAVYEEVAKIMRFWLDLGAAGFRCDVINLIWKESYDDGKKIVYLTGKEHYLSQTKSHEILKRLNEEVLAPYDAFTVGETSNVTLEAAKQYTDNELTTVFPFEHMEADSVILPVWKIKYKPKYMIKILDKWQVNFNANWGTLFFENHDQPRSISRFGSENKYYYESGTALANVLLTLRGTPFIYQGEEIGMINYPFKSMDLIKDVTHLGVYKLMREKYHIPHKIAFKWSTSISRDHARTPMQWSNEPNAGFTSGTPWLVVNESYHKINAKQNQKDDPSILKYYQALLALRKKHVALRYGTYTKLPSHKDVYAYLRSYEDEKILVVTNMGGKKIKSKVDMKGELLLSNYKTHDESILSPYETRIIKL